MFSSLVNVYSTELKIWAAGINAEIEQLDQTTNPVQFQHSFFKYLLHIIYFDALWREIGLVIQSFFSNTLKFHSDLGLPQPENLLLLDTAIPIAATITEVRKRRSYSDVVESSTLCSMIPGSSKAYSLFEKAVQNVEKYTGKYPKVVHTYLRECLDVQKKTTIEIESLLHQSPPPTFHELSPLLQELLVSSILFGKVGGTKAPQLSRLENVTFRVFLPILMRYINGQETLYTFNKLLHEVRIQAESQTPALEEIRNIRRDNKDRISKLKNRLKAYSQTAALEPKVLETLTKMDPEFPVFLPRLAELVEEEKELTEAALKFVLQRAPDIGKYDSMSQVLKFSKPEETHARIGTLLQSYRDRSFDELLDLLRREEAITQHERTSLVTHLSTHLEAILQETVKPEEKLDLVNLIDSALDKGFLNEEETNLLHKFRKRRNELVHNKGVPLSAKLILSTKKILDKFG